MDFKNLNLEFIYDLDGYGVFLLAEPQTTKKHKSSEKRKLIFTALTGLNIAKSAF